MRFTAIRPGYSLPSLCDGLRQDFQTLDGVYFCFIHRGTTDTLFLVTDGRTISLTPSLRSISYGGGMLDPDIPGMSDQRHAYRQFNQAIAPTVSSRGTPTSTARSAALLRLSTRTASTALTYATVAQSPSQQETSLRTLARQDTRLVVQELFFLLEKP